MADWDIGTQVVCIKEFVGKRAYNEKHPFVGQILTIRDIVDDTDANSKRLFLRFYEIVNPEHFYIDRISEVCFLWTHFRPVRKTDISSIIEVAKKLPNKEELMTELESEKELVDV